MLLHFFDLIFPPEFSLVLATCARLLELWWPPLAAFVLVSLWIRDEKRNR